MQRPQRPLDRAAFLGCTAAALAGFAAACAAGPADAASPAATSVPPGDALARLAAGNQRFVSGDLQNRSNIDERRTALAGGQAPYATVLTCSDARTPPELIFDETVGDLFVIRIAGNYVTDDGLGTMEYGYEKLGSHLLLVLGHGSCGAVTATYDSLKTGKPLPPHLSAISHAVGPGIEAVVRRNGSIDEAIEANVRAQVAAAGAGSPVLGSGVSDRTLRIVGGIYDLASGAVTLLQD
jgi:carbonic anhydrase